MKLTRKYRLFLEQLRYDRFRGERLSLDQLMGQRLLMVLVLLADEILEC